MQRRTFLTAAAAAALARPAIAQGTSRVLRYIPQADLANPDPVWSTATISAIHAKLIWDNLYGLDENLIPQRQMVALARCRSQSSEVAARSRSPDQPAPDVKDPRSRLRCPSPKGCLASRARATRTATSL